MKKCLAFLVSVVVSLTACGMSPPLEEAPPVLASPPSPARTQTSQVPTDIPTPAPPPPTPTSTNTVPPPTPVCGGLIAFTSDRDGNNEIYVMNADGTGQTNLINDPADDSRPSWSPRCWEAASEST